MAACSISRVVHLAGPGAANRASRRRDYLLQQTRAVDEPFIATVSTDNAWVLASFARAAGNVWSNPELLTRLLGTMLDEVSATDPKTLIVAALAVVAVAFLAAYVPARRAGRVRPDRAPTTRVARGPTTPKLAPTGVARRGTERVTTAPTPTRTTVEQDVAGKSTDCLCQNCVRYPPNAGQTPSFTGARRSRSLLREVVDRECVGAFLWASHA